jgi:predicted transcriptional regulator
MSKIVPEERENDKIILREVESNPGITQLELRDQFEMAWGTVHYHVRKLRDYGRVKAYTQEPRTHLFSPEIPDEVMPAIAALRRDRAEEILNAIESPKQSFELQNDLGLGKNVVKAHLVRLHAAGLVVKEGQVRAKYAKNQGFVKQVLEHFSRRNGE